MPRHGTLRGVGLTALGDVVVAGSFVALGLRPDGIASYYRDTLTPAGFAIWFCGFVAATLAPPAIAVLCWFGAMRFRYGWLLHILLVPATYAAVRGSIALMLAVASEPDSDGPTRRSEERRVGKECVSPCRYRLARCHYKTKQPT